VTSKQSLQKEFTAAIAESVKRVCKDFNITDIAIEDDDPTVLAVRGTLEREKCEPEAVEMIIAISKSIQKAQLAGDASGQIHATVAVAASHEIYQSFDLSASMREDTVAGGGREPDPCEDEKQEQAYRALNEFIVKLKR
jgi:hypothetical protein